ncbi:EamA family transporter [Mesorhizobium sp. J18]|uniref:DMT family transporter n=1 Tax=Mesorhizobium sp. J18 TaxID=935263 RepID=UPI001AEEF101|nr:EamA family transporter [Mesorhizobium sp. J18]
MSAGLAGLQSDRTITALKGTLLGAIAILSWGSLGALGALAAAMPPYLVLGLCFSIAAVTGTGCCAIARVRLVPLYAPEVLLAAFLLGAYHLAYFEAFHHAEAIPVSLINYLWPAWLIVIGNLFFALNSGWAGYLGAAIGFAGVAILIGGDFDVKTGDTLGYALAMAGAILWATYSNLRRRARHEGMGAMVSICILASLFCFAIALFAGEIFMPTRQDMLVILLLGIGPAGGAFFLWDYGMRFGNAPLLGVMGYSAPVLSTGLMVLLGMGQLSWRMAAAVAMITLGGAVIQIGSRTGAAGYTAARRISLRRG